MKLRHHMLLRIAGPLLVIYVLILGLAGWSLYNQSRAEAERAMTRLATSYAARLDGYLREAARVATTTAQFMRHADRLSDEEIYEQLEQGVEQMPLIYGSCLAFEPGTRKPAGELFAPYVCRAEGALRRVNIDRGVYDWYADPQYTWYSAPRELRRAVWSDPYFDEGAGNILMSTYSAPFDSGEGFGGVCTVDIDLPNLRRTVGSEMSEDMDFVILAADGRYVYNPDPTRIMARTITEYAREENRGGLSVLAPRMLANASSGSAWIDGWESSEPIGVFYAPVPSTGWVFACRMPTETVLQGVRDRMILGASALVIALLLIGGCIYFVAGRIAAPIAALEKKVTEVTRGDLDARIDEPASAVEIRALARSFNNMTADLRANLERLSVEKAARTQMEHDLNVARQIQKSLLPTTPPVIAGFEVAGWNQAADQTGGDYFDWIELPDGRVVLVIADATGHGIGPALLIAVCRAYFRASMRHDTSVRDVMSQVNELLLDDLPEGRFVTAALCMVDPATATIEIFSAGHGPTLLYSASSNEVTMLEADEMPLGVDAMQEVPAVCSQSLSTGDVVVLLTDGFFEWLNSGNEQYGTERLREFLRANHGANPEEIIQRLHKDVLRHAAGTTQADDLTIIVMKRVSTA